MASIHPIIVEGPDGSGKTTLARQLAQDYRLEYRRPSPEDLSSSHGPVGSGLVSWWDDQLARDPAYQAKGIYDRCFYISDPIYQQAQVDRDLLIDGVSLTRGLFKLYNSEPILIFCLPPFEVQIANVRKSGRDRLEGVSDKALEKVSNAYFAAFAMWANSLFESTIRYDYANDNEEYLHNLLASLGVTV